MERKTLAFVAINMSFTLNVLAQASFTTIDSININNISASVLVHGDMWWTGPVINYTPKCFFPAGTNKNISFAGALWMSAYDASGQLHVAAQTFRQNGNDYWPGPLDDHDTLTYATSCAWAKIWKVNRTDIQSFLSTATHTVSNTPGSILTWPAKGNPYALGNGGISLTISRDMAPFVDNNGNGIYEPLLGEYPDVKGDQALWHIFSDHGPVHTETNGKPLGVEVQAMSYAYKRGTLIDNVVYYDYKITNKSANNYNNMRIGQWRNSDLGYPFDDYIGFDSTWRLAITYNATTDDGSTAGHPDGCYGPTPPQVGITMVVSPGDNGSFHVPAGSFVFYNNDGSASGNPVADTEYNNYLRARFRDGRHFKKGYSGPGLPCWTLDSGADINYIYAGDPSDNNGWSECACHNSPYERRSILSSGDFSLNSGTSQRLVLALIVADSAGGCGATSFDKIRIVADTAWGNYFKVTGINEPRRENTIKVFPNPAHDQLNIEVSSILTNDMHFTVCNPLGQQVDVPISTSKNAHTADIHNLAAGIYYLRLQGGNTVSTAKFVKQ